jgi:hypothetical protein
VRKAPFVLLGLTVVLAVTASASGTVQRLITGRSILDNSITSTDIKNNTIVRKDLNNRLASSLHGSRGARGTAGVRGARGATGAKGVTGAAGANGAPGASALSTVPAGVTIHGVVGLDVDAAGAGGDWGTLGTMGMPGSVVLGDTQVSVNCCAGWENLGGNTPPTTFDSDAACTGSATAPTAPSGKVCVYVLHSDNANDLFGYGVGSNQGFKLNFTNLAPGDSFVDAVWAYTG